MIPAGFATNGSMTFRMTGFFAEVFDNLQVRTVSLKEFMTNFLFNIISDRLLFPYRI